MVIRRSKQKTSIRLRENTSSTEEITFSSKAFLSYKYMFLQVQKLRALLEENVFNKKSSGSFDWISTRSFF